MIKDLLFWVAPGVLTVVGGTGVAMSMATPVMVADLAAQGRAQLDASGAKWANVSVVARDLVLTGTTDTEQKREAAERTLAAMQGVGAIENDIALAPLATPFKLKVAVEDEALTLSGSVPSEAARQDLLQRVNVAETKLEVGAGYPDLKHWSEGVNFALARAADMESGEIELSDLELTVKGRAKSQGAFGALQMALADIPAGLSLKSSTVEPMQVAPYTWTARFDGERIEVAGYAPDQQTIDRFRTADLSNAPLATGLSLASGAPEGFADLSRTLLEQLAQLEEGEASIVDGTSRLSGRPATVEIAQAVNNGLSGTGSIVTLEPPPVSDYWVSVTRQSGGVLVFDGFVPNEATREALAETEGADVNFLKLGGGAPASYQAGLDFALSLLTHMSEGRVALSGEVLSVTGIAQSPTDYGTLRTLVATRLPQGITAGSIEVAAPRAARYEFSASRQEDGITTLAGMLPSPEIEQQLVTVAGTKTSSEVSYASGEPNNFVTAARQAIAFLPWLEEGAVRFDGTNWTVEGVPSSTIDRGAIQTEFAVNGLAQAGWSLDLTEAGPVAQPVSPYIWSAERLRDGSFLFTGNVPAGSLRDYLAVHVETRVTDTTKVSPGAPDGFAAKVRGAVDALLELEQGTALFDGENWTVTGTAENDERRAASLALLTAALDLDASGSISAPEPQVVAEPKPAADQQPDEPQEAPAAATTSPELLAQCREQVATLSAHNAILFQSGAAIIASSAAPELDAFAQALAICPNTSIYVEGHTDSDGDERKNLALSVARAEAVVAALIERGVAAERLYAVGYGESQPVAGNDTPDGKRQNRRIVVSVQDENN
ncbi:OmpA family protein [Devosia rhizoryzae]|uniref:OmpA family protein n=1 Tax=Devosia rhizoryzae TaxID=2774137 RepID=A0ABX7CDR0_9HYPH|nr:OmpA family protein [Devosia rhizoryzae]QQR40947.1 OmpA family protein [Devosia rhizoryzae]